MQGLASVEIEKGKPKRRLLKPMLFRLHYASPQESPGVAGRNWTFHGKVLPPHIRVVSSFLPNDFSLWAELPKFAPAKIEAGCPLRPSIWAKHRKKRDIFRSPAMIVPNKKGEKEKKEKRNKEKKRNTKYWPVLARDPERIPSFSRPDAMGAPSTCSLQLPVLGRKALTAPDGTSAQGELG